MQILKVKKDYGQSNTILAWNTYLLKHINDLYKQKHYMYPVHCCWLILEAAYFTQHCTVSILFVIKHQKKESCQTDCNIVV